jgi:hypothetical protein
LQKNNLSFGLQKKKEPPADQDGSFCKKPIKGQSQLRLAYAPQHQTRQDSFGL